MRILSLTLVALLLLAAPLPAADKPDKRPNILYIMADDHAAHAISAYGSKVNKTPNIDRLAKDGMRFTECFCHQFDLHAEPRRHPHRAVCPHQWRSRLQPARPQTADARQVFAEGRL